MSGFEVAGVALGAIPIILEAIKGYRDTYNYIQSFKHAKKQLNIIVAKFKVCRLNFLNECQLLLDLITFDSQLTREMISNPQHHLWRKDTIQREMVNLLKDNMDACSTIISDTRSVITEFLAKLSKLRTTSGSSSKSSLQRARSSATFMIEKRGLERDIELLRQRNADMHLLREQITSLRPRSGAVRGRAISAESLTVVKNFTQIQLACRLLHETLKSSWSCLDQTHLRHYAKLSIDSVCESETEPSAVNLDIAISCETALQARNNDATIWLFVQSESSTVDSGVSADPLGDLVQSLCLDEPQASSLKSTIHKSMSKISTTPSTASGTKTAVQEVDICTVACMCSHFQRQIHAAKATKQHPQCLGFLKSQHDARHVFYIPNRSRPVTAMANALENVTNLIKLIDNTQKASLDLVLQYSLALKIATSVLQFHSTPWLSSAWELQDISIFGSKLNDDTLKTLHLSSRFAPLERDAGQAQTQIQPAELTVSAAGTPSNMSPVDRCCKRLCPSIYNETLFSLGIALLEIAHWQSFRSLTQHDPDEFHAANRLVRGPAPLGPRYRKIVERCIRCDFEAGSENLEDASLQYAVWSKAVYPLESLIRDTS